MTGDGIEREPEGGTVTSVEVLVLGGGPAGLMAGLRAAERGRRTLILEKNSKPAPKILISGGTRCNLTQNTDRRGIVEAFGPAGRFLHSALSRLGPSDVRDLFHAEGVPTKIEPTGKVFPASDRALHVQQALVARVKRSGATLALAEAAQSVTQSGETFVVTTDRRTIVADRVVLATGGRSYPGCGTTGDGYAFAAALGHTIERPRPALVPLVCDEAWVRELSGVTIPDMHLAVLVAAGGDPPAKSLRWSKRPGVLIERRGSVLFTHFGLSGPTALDVSRALTETTRPVDRTLVADFVPTVPADTIETTLREAAARDGRRLVVNALPEELPRRLTEALVRTADVPLDRKTAELSRDERTRLIERIKRCPIAVVGNRGFEKAEVTAGGVSLAEVDSKTLESKRVPGLFLVGEVLDLDGFIGGYNFQAAFATGYTAGESL